MKKIKVLQLVPGLDAGGISMLLLNYYKNMDRNKIQFDFAIFYDNIGLTGKEFKKMGSKIYHLPKKSLDFKGYIKSLKNILKENNYDIVHAHQNYQSFIPLQLAKKCGIKVRISHCHTTLPDPGYKQKILSIIGKLLNNLYATDKFACGIEAGKFLYGKKINNKQNFFILNNAIDVKKYIYNEKIRNKIRKELHVSNKFVIGTIGRLSKQKNQKFAIDVFKEVYEKNNNAELIIVGNGELEKELKSYVNKLNLNNNVLFLGKRTDVNELLQGFDVFILPSLYEGLPIVGVEAISSSIPCIFSDTITKELKVRENIKYIKKYNIDEWSKEILTYQDFKRIENSKEVMMNLYDIKKNAKLLENKYIELVRNR